MVSEFRERLTIIKTQALIAKYLPTNIGILYDGHSISSGALNRASNRVSVFFFYTHVFYIYGQINRRIIYSFSAPPPHRHAMTADLARHRTRELSSRIAAARAIYIGWR